MSEFKTRLITEIKEETVKATKLDSFINSPNFESIDEAQKPLLKAQYGIMRSFICILTTRLELLS